MHLGRGDTGSVGAHGGGEVADQGNDGVAGGGSGVGEAVEVEALGSARGGDGLGVLNGDQPGGRRGSGQRGFHVEQCKEPRCGCGTRRSPLGRPRR